MKKLFIFAALAFGFASCESTNENDLGFVNNDQKAVEFTVKVTAPEVEETRVANLSYVDSAKGGLVNNVLSADDVTLRYILEIYDANNRRSDEILVQYVDSQSCDFNPRLIPNRYYRFVVWVDIVKKDANGKWVNPYYNTTNLRNVTINADAWKPMDEYRDAFTGFTEVQNLTNTSGTNNSNVIDVKCTRPFAKLRIITTDEVAVANLDVTPDYAEVTYEDVPVYSFDAFNGNYTTIVNGAINKKSHTFFEIINYTSNDSANDPDSNEFCLFTDYFFAPSENQVSLGHFTLSVYDNNNKDAEGNYTSLITTNHFTTEIPLKRNTLTTIQGNLLTVQDFVVRANTMDQFEGTL